MELSWVKFILIRKYMEGGRTAMASAMGGVRHSQGRNHALT